MKSFLILLGEKQSDLMTGDLLTLHVNYLKQLNDEGHLILCGPFIDNKGAVLILRANSKEEVHELIKQDPFITENYYKNFLIQEFIEANDENDWLMNSIA